MDWNAAIEDNNNNKSLIDLKSLLTITTRERSRSTQKNKWLCGKILIQENVFPTYFSFSSYCKLSRSDQSYETPTVLFLDCKIRFLFTFFSSTAN